MIFGFDPGFGHTKAAFLKDGKMCQTKLQSVVAWTAEGGGDNFDYMRRYWIVGERALKSGNIVEITNYDELKDYAPLLLMAAIEKAELDPDQIDQVVCGLSLAHSRRAKEFAAHLSSFEMNGREYRFKVGLIPQGVGARHAISEKYGDAEDYMVIDIGSNTMDTLAVIGGETEVSTLSGHENRGVRRIAALLQQEIVAMGMGHVTLPEATKILEKGSIQHYGVETDLSEEIARISNVFTSETMGYIKEEYDNELKKLDKIFFVGGGSYFVDQKMMPHFVVPEDPEYFNAIGNALGGASL